MYSRLLGLFLVSAAMGCSLTDIFGGSGQPATDPDASSPDAQQAAWQDGPSASDHVDPPLIDSCTPLTCASLGLTCGMPLDGCGKQLDCGPCLAEAGTIRGANGPIVCFRDSDCSPLGAHYVCQVDTGSCTTTKIVRTKGIGTACTTADPAACNCLVRPIVGHSIGQGYCTVACVLGATGIDGTCPQGFLCMNKPLSPVTSESAPSLGNCFQDCATVMNRCPMPSTCDLSPVGTVCVP
jgi:hypothetical protein